MADTPPDPDRPAPPPRKFPRRQAIVIAGVGGLAAVGWGVSRAIGNDSGGSDEPSAGSAPSTSDQTDTTERQRREERSDDQTKEERKAEKRAEREARTRRRRIGRDRGLQPADDPRPPGVDAAGPADRSRVHEGSHRCPRHGRPVERCGNVGRRAAGRGRSRRRRRSRPARRRRHRRRCAHRVRRFPGARSGRQPPAGIERQRRRRRPPDDAAGRPRPSSTTSSSSASTRRASSVDTRTHRWTPTSGCGSSVPGCSTPRARRRRHGPTSPVAPRRVTPGSPSMRPPGGRSVTRS